MKMAKTQRSVLLCSYAFHAFLILTIGVYFTSTLNAPYSAYALTTPMCWLCVVFAMIYIITGFKIKQAPKKEDGEAAAV